MFSFLRSITPYFRRFFSLYLRNFLSHTLIYGALYFEISTLLFNFLIEISRLEILKVTLLIRILIWLEIQLFIINYFILWFVILHLWNFIRISIFHLLFYLFDLLIAFFIYLLILIISLSRFFIYELSQVPFVFPLFI